MSDESMQTPDVSHAAPAKDTRDVIVDASHVSMVFNMASEQLNSLKEYFIKLMRH